MADKSRFIVRSAVQIGLIGGAVAVLLSLVGMVQAFSQRDIIAGVISMGQSLLLAMFFMSGLLTGRKSAGGRLVTTLQGALAGLVSGGMITLLTLIGTAVDLRQVLINASPQLFQTLSFKSGAIGAYYPLAVGALAGGLGAFLDTLPARLRQALITGLIWTTTVGVLQDLLRVTLLGPVIGFVRWMFGSQGQKGLSVIGAIVVFAATSGFSYFWFTRGGVLAARLQALPPARQRAVRWGSLAFTFAFLLYVPNLLGVYLSEVANVVGIFVLMGLGLNIVVGFAGLLDLGYVAFYAIGAYTMALLTTTSGEMVVSVGMSFWAALPIAVGVSVLAGVLLGIPVLKIRGDYLAIVTLGFGEIIRILALSDFLKPLLGGSNGIVRIAKASIAGFAFDRPQTLFYLIIVACAAVAFISIRLKDSRMGRAWMAMREDEDVAQAMGVDLVATKLLAFGTGAAAAGLSGAIFAVKLGTINALSFQLLVSINTLALIIVGGMGSIPGVIIGALALVGLPELLREFAEFRLLVYGAVLVAMMLLRPEGLLPEETHRRELHEADLAPSAGTEALPESSAAIAH